MCSKGVFESRLFKLELGIPDVNLILQSQIYHWLTGCFFNCVARLKILHHPIFSLNVKLHSHKEFMVKIDCLSGLLNACQVGEDDSVRRGKFSHQEGIA